MFTRREISNSHRGVDALEPTATGQSHIRHLPSSPLSGHEAGFTIMELLITTVMVAILSVLALAQFSTYKEGAFDAESVEWVGQISDAVQAYLADNESPASAVVYSISGGAVTNSSLDLTTYLPWLSDASGKYISVTLQPSGAWVIRTLHCNGREHHLYDSSIATIVTTKYSDAQKTSLGC